MRTIIRILATLVLMLGAAAPSFAAGGGTPILNDKPWNYGQCSKAGVVNPQDGTAGPFTHNRNNTNWGPGQIEKHGIGYACPHPDKL